MGSPVCPLDCTVCSYTVYTIIRQCLAIFLLNAISCVLAEPEPYRGYGGYGRGRGYGGHRGYGGYRGGYGKRSAEPTAIAEPEATPDAEPYYGGYGYGGYGGYRGYGGYGYGGYRGRYYGKRSADPE